jgi:hypothetical protein
MESGCSHLLRTISAKWDPKRYRTGSVAHALCAPRAINNRWFAATFLKIPLTELCLILSAGNDN